MTEPNPYDLDKRLELLEHTVNQGIDRMLAEIERLSERFDADVTDIKATTCRNERRLNDIEPFVLSAKATWVIVWKLIIVVAVAGLAWAVSQSGALLP